MQTVHNVTEFIPESNKWSTTQSAVAAFVLIVINIFSLLCNLLIMATTAFTKTKTAQERSEAPLVANLAFTDLMVAVLLMPFSVDVLLHDKIRVSEGMTEFIGFGNFLFCIASIINLTILAVDQLLIITWPFKFKALRPTSFPRLAVACIWIHSACCAIPPYFGISSYSCFIPNIGPCSQEQWAGNDYAVIFTVFVILCSWGIGISTLVFAYAVIYRVVLKQRKAINDSMVHQTGCGVMARRISSFASTDGSKTEVHRTQDVDHSREFPSQATGPSITGIAAAGTNERDTKNCHKKQAGIGGWLTTKRVCLPRRRGRARCSCIPDAKPATSLLIIVLVYFISWTPFCIVLLLEIAVKKKEYNELSLLFLWIGHSSSLSNPLMYLYRFKRFRKAAMGLICRIFHCNVAGVGPE